MNFRPVVVAPTFDNADALPDVLDRLAAVGVPVIVVDDGCTDGTADILAPRAQSGELVEVVRHPRNQGKAAALQSGFACATRHGYTHALTIDTDGQLEPEEVPALLDAAAQSPEALVLGVRDEHTPDYPARSRLGRRVSNCLIRIEGGARVGDSQCGMRVYPLGLTRLLKCRAQRYGYETEIITRAAWAGCPIVQVPVRCTYLPDGQQVSHFRVWRDSFRGVGMHLRLIVRALCPWPHRKWTRAGESAQPQTWRELVRQLSPRKTWQLLQEDEQARLMFAVGLGVGVFIANIPIYGLQTVFALYTARRLHLHPVAVVLGSQASTPPIGIALGVVATFVGSVLLYGRAPALPEHSGTLQTLAQAPWLLLAWFVGSLIVGAILGSLTLGAALVLMRWMLPARSVDQAVSAAPAELEVEA